MASKIDETHVYTDGSASIKAGDGAWAFCAIDTLTKESVSHCGRHEKGKTGEMELMAVQRALQFVDLHPSPLHFFCDSRYAIRCATVFVATWKRNGWLTSVGEEVKNQDIVKEIDRLIALHKQVRKVVFNHVKGHSGVYYNEIVDTLAGDCRKRMIGSTWNDSIIKPYAR